MEREQFLYVLRPARPEMLAGGPTAAEQDVISRHAAYCDGLSNAGVMLMVGRTQTTTPDTIGLAVFLAKDEVEAHSIMDGDPAVKEGVMRAQLFPYRIAFGNAEAFRLALESAG